MTRSWNNDTWKDEGTNEDYSIGHSDDCNDLGLRLMIQIYSFSDFPQSCRKSAETEVFRSTVIKHSSDDIEAAMPCSKVENAAKPAFQITGERGGNISHKNHSQQEFTVAGFCTCCKTDQRVEHTRAKSLST